MLWQLIIVIAIIWVIFDHFIRHWKFRSILCVPKINAPSYFLIGSALFLLGNDEDRMIALQSFGQQANAVGGILRTWFGRRLFLCVTDPETVEVVLKTFLEKDDLTKTFRILTGTGSILAPGSIWKPRRKIIQPAFSPNILKTFNNIFNDNADIVCQQLKDVVKNKPFSMWPYLATYNMNAICETNLGMKINAHLNHDQPFLNASELAFKALAQRVCEPWQQIDSFYKFFPIYNKLIKAIQCIKDFNMEIIKTKRHKRVDKNEKQSKVISHGAGARITPKPFVDLLLDIAETTNNLSDSDIRDECIVMSLAATDTSACNVCFTLCSLARYPEVQEKLYNELREVFGDSNRTIENEDLSKLTYLDAVIKETLRLYPPVPIIVRKVDKKFTLPSGLTVLPDIGIVINIWAIHHDPAHWGPDVDIYRPERFLDLNIHPCSFIPFSNGPRNCLGYRYAMTSMKIILCKILRRYRILPPPELMDSADIKNYKNIETPMRVKFDIMMKDVDNFTIQLVDRK